MPYPVAACRNKNELGNSDLCALNLSNGGGDTFNCYSEQDPVIQSLGSGSRWNGAWNISTNYNQIIGQETFEFYNEGSDVSNLNAGSGWSGAWAVQGNYGGTVFKDTFDTYDINGPII